MIYKSRLKHDTVGKYTSVCFDDDGTWVAHNQQLHLPEYELQEEQASHLA